MQSYDTIFEKVGTHPIFAVYRMLQYYSELFIQHL